MILAKIQADSVEDSLLFYSCQSLDGEGDFVSLAIRFAILCVRIIIIISIWVTIKGGLVTRYRTKKIKFLDFLCSSDCSSIFFRIFSLIPNNASLQEVV